MPPDPLPIARAVEPPRRKREWLRTVGMVLLGLTPLYLFGAFMLWQTRMFNNDVEGTRIPLVRKKGDPIVLEPGAVRSGTVKLTERAAFVIEVMAAEGDVIDIGVGPTAGPEPTSQEVEAALATGDRRVSAQWHTLVRPLDPGSFVWVIRNASADRRISMQVYLSHPSQLSR